MAKIKGCKGALVYDGNLVATMNQIDLDRTAGTEDVSSFGSCDVVTDTTTKQWSVSFSGFTSDSDTTGQDVLETAYNNQTKLDEKLRIYLKYSTTSGDEVIYYHPAVGSDGCVITSIKNGISWANTQTISMTIEGAGGLTKVKETLT